MREYSPDTTRVYHNGDRPLRDEHATAGDAPVVATSNPAAPHAYPTGVDDEVPVRPPWRFALCAAFPEDPSDSDDVHDLDDPRISDTVDDRDGGEVGNSVASLTEEAGESDDPDETDRKAPLVETFTPEVIDLLDLEEVVMWGLESAEATVVYGINPITGRRLSGTFGSAEHARVSLGRVGPLRLVYC